MPWRILSRPTAIRRFLVASSLADVTQQIHSLRARGVISAHIFFAAASEAIAALKSAGMRCGAREVIVGFDIILDEDPRSFLPLGG
jgi:hypothetical protein